MTEIDAQDRLTRFLIQGAGVRGAHVRLDRTWAELRKRSDCPAAAVTLLGEATAAAALFTAHVKVDGRLSIQLRGEGPLRTLFAECTAAGTLRGIAHLNETAKLGLSAGGLGTLVTGGLLAITIENPSAKGAEPARYQGMVSLDSATLSAAFEGYFLQSEQLPTRLLLAAEGQNVAGLILQKLPGDEGDTDGWDRANALFNTLGAPELLDSDGEQLLRRLFHEDGVRILGEKSLRFACSCSRERVSAMLESLGEAEARAAAQENHGLAEIRCEFCGEVYRYSETEIDALFRLRPVSLAPPERLQ
ncbi:MAG: Hsp33 family molecular chaperone HslO [Lysobacteraceae bacterium]|nr:MAG: Hsp33 family molecular chaperone HslO [Xanthomonadaceae bacterium]